MTDIWPNTPGTPPINPNPESWPVLGEGPFPPRPNGTPPHLLDPSTPSPLLVLFDPVGEISPEQVANDIVTGPANPAPNQDAVHTVGDALGAAVADQARNLAAQNPGTLRHVDVAALPPEEQARLTQAFSGAGEGVSHADRAVGGDPLGAAVPPHSDPYNRALRHQIPEQAQRHVSQANNQRHALGNPGAEYLPRQQVNFPLPSSQTPAPPSTGNPIANRAIQLAQGRFQQPNGFPASAFDHVGFGQQAIAETLARLMGGANTGTSKMSGMGPPALRIPIADSGYDNRQRQPLGSVGVPLSYSDQQGSGATLAVAEPLPSEMGPSATVETDELIKGVPESTWREGEKRFINMMRSHWSDEKKQGYIDNQIAELRAEVE